MKLETIKNNTLWNLILKNEHLRIIDAQTENSFRVDEICLNLNSRLLKKKKLVFLYLDHTIESLCIYLSFLATNHALVLLSNSLEESLKINLEEKYEPQIIFDQKRNSLKRYNHILLANKNIELGVFYTESSTQKIHENIKVLLSTSGTTGSPKFVKLSHDNLLENAKSIVDYLPINANDVVPLNLPLHYSYGLSVLHSNGISGGKIVCGLPDILNPDFWKMLEYYRFTSIAGVPFVYEMLGRIGFTKKTYNSLKYLTQAGGNLSTNIKSKFLEYCQNNAINFFVMYGQTEATARISYVPPQKLGEKLSSIGRPIKKGELDIDEATGELLYKGPNIFGGYTENRSSLNEWKQQIPLRTGDIGFVDKDGFYFIKGRLKRFAKVFGNRINLDEIEAYLKGSLDMSLVACVGLEDKKILVAHSIALIDEVRVKKSIFDKYKIPISAIECRFYEELPKTNNGKINYKQLK